MSRNRILIIIGIGAALFIGALGVIFGLRGASAPEAAVITFWGMDDEEGLWRSAIIEFHAQHPSIEVKYRSVPAAEYESTLLNAIAEGRGPDVFMLVNAQIAQHRDKIIPLPQKTLQFFVKDFQAAFADIAVADLITDEQEIIGVPIFIDSMALLYNKDTLNAAGVAEPPDTREELTNLAHTLTKTDPSGEIAFSGLAAGTGANTEHAFELMSALILQNGDPIVRPGVRDAILGDRTRDALAFYSSFTDPRSRAFSWTSRAGNSLDALAEEKAAMALGFFRDLARIKKQNPHINLGVARFPQRAGATNPLTYGSFVFPTVSKLSRHPIPAWQLALFLGSRDAAAGYLEATGLAPARRDLIAAGAHSANQEIFYRQALIAKDWRIPNYSSTRRIFEQIADALASRATNPAEARSRLQQQISILLP